MNTLFKTKITDLQPKMLYLASTNIQSAIPNAQKVSAIEGNNQFIIYNKNGRTLKRLGYKKYFYAEVFGSTHVDGIKVLFKGDFFKFRHLREMHRYTLLLNSDKHNPVEVGKKLLAITLEDEYEVCIEKTIPDKDGADTRIYLKYLHGKTPVTTKEVEQPKVQSMATELITSVTVKPSLVARVLKFFKDLF